MLPACHNVEELRSSIDRVSLSLSFPSASQRRQDAGKCLASSTDGPPPLSDRAPSDLKSRPLCSPAKSSGGGLTRKYHGADDRRTTRSAQRTSRRRASRGSNAARVSYKRLTSPDRFLPERQFQPRAGESLRLSKDPRMLRPREKIQRRRDPEYDPFRSADVVVRWPFSSSREPDPNYTLSSRRLPWQVGPTLLDIDSDQEPTNRTGHQGNAQSVQNVSGITVNRPNPSAAVSDGQGRLLGSGTVAPMHDARFPIRDAPEQRLQSHQSRIALALDIDQATRVLNLCDCSSSSSPISSPTSPVRPPTSPTWKDAAWVREGPETLSKQSALKSQRSIPSLPFRVLDAPLLRDDYYCSTLAYCHVADVLAVGLGAHVYLWSETTGVEHPPLGPPDKPTDYVTSVSFSSRQGRRSILAIGRYSGKISLWSTFDTEIRLEKSLPYAVSCVAFKDSTTLRRSEGFRDVLVDTEDLVVGDDTGTLWYYAVEWTNRKTWNSTGTKGSMTLLAQIEAHTQQLCGMTWSPNGKYLATGGNDNVCLVFDVAEILRTSAAQTQADPTRRAWQSADLRHVRSDRRHRSYSCPNGAYERYSYGKDDLVPTSHQLAYRSISTRSCPPAGLDRSRLSRNLTHFMPPGREKHRLPHAAAVKALTFAPWQPSLLATGGGSNDRCIRFYHAPSGSCLATIRVYAQVTSLIWSKTRREIAATFGYAKPPHPFRIAVFAWPSCQQVIAIPWGASSDVETYGEIGRALWAISYPGAPNGMIHEDDTSDDDGGGDAARQRTRPAVHSISSTTASRRESATRAAYDPSGTLPRAGSFDRPANARRRSSYKEGERWWRRTAEEGCIVVACSNECIKFHEVWSGDRKTVAGGAAGILGGSDILETLEGIEKEGKEVIR